MNSMETRKERRNRMITEICFWTYVALCPIIIATLTYVYAFKSTPTDILPQLTLWLMLGVFGNNIYVGVRNKKQKKSNLQK